MRSTGQVSAHFAQIYGASVSKETVRRITDKVIVEMNDWAARPLDEVYAATFIDVIVCVKPIYTAPNPNAVRAALEDLDEKWGKNYGAIIRLRESAWEEFIPFLDCDLEIRTVICSTNAIESFNVRYRRAVRARGHFPTEQAALKCLYLVTRIHRPHRSRHGTMDDALEAGSQRVRHHLRRPLAGSGDQLDEDRRKHR